jgi:hypothetical protein
MAANGFAQQSQAFGGFPRFAVDATLRRVMKARWAVSGVQFPDIIHHLGSR